MTGFEDKVVYQIYPKSFKDSNGDGMGDIRGVLEKLDYLKDLGVDYLWMTPFFPSPQNDNGYDVADYRKIDPRFGTMEDLECLIEEAKKRGIGIMLDMVFNHTSTEHEWFQKALAGEKKYQDYYLFQEGEKDQMPTNWESKFGGPVWEYVDHLEKWYLHLFHVTQADLNWENKAVREELKDILRFWKKKGIKGFRFDVVNLISKPSTWENDDQGDGRRFYTDGPKVHTFLKELIQDAEVEDLLTVGEMSSTSVDHCIRYSNPKEREITMCFNFHHLKVDYKDGDKWKIMEPDFRVLKELFQTWQEEMQAGEGWNALFFCNHDQPRIVSRLGDEGIYHRASATMLGGMIHLMRGTPYIYQGEEIGMTNAHYKGIESYRDIESLNYYDILKNKGKNEDEVLDIIGKRSRDNGRTPMQWDDSMYHGFSTVEPWLEMADNGEVINVAAQEKDEHSILTFYKKLVQFRKEQPLVSKGSIAFLETGCDQVMAYVRAYKGEELLVCCNLSKEEQLLEVDERFLGREKKLGNYLDTIQEEAGKIKLHPFEFVAL